MEFTDFRETYNYQRDELLTNLSDWSEQLVQLLEARVFAEHFNSLMKMFLSFDYSPVNQLTEEERESQLEICSQMHATFETLSGEMAIYLRRVHLKYDSWAAGKLIQARAAVIDVKAGWCRDGKITKANVSATGDEVRQRFLVINENENNAWNGYIDHVERAKNLVKAITTDIEKRSMILMSLRKKQQN